VNYDVNLGYPVGGDCGQQRAILTVSREKLVLKPYGEESIAFAPHEVVEFRLDGMIPFLTQAIVIEHVAYGRIGSVAFYPDSGTCKQLLAEIKLLGFTPSGTLGVPWEPGQPFPYEELEDDGDAQHQPAP